MAEIKVVEVEVGPISVIEVLVPGPQGPSSFDAAVFVPERPDAAQLVFRHAFSKPVAFPAGLTASQASAEAAATAQAVFTLEKNGIAFGTVTFAAASAQGVFAAAQATSFAAEDVLTVTAPNPRDDTLADISITLAGNL